MNNFFHFLYCNTEVLGIFANPFFMSENCKKGGKKNSHIYKKYISFFPFPCTMGRKLWNLLPSFSSSRFPFFSSPFQPHKYTHLWPKPRISPTCIPDGWKKFYEIIFTMFWIRGMRSILSHTCSKKEVRKYQCNAQINIVNSFRWGSRGPKTRLNTVVTY